MKHLTLNQKVNILIGTVLTVLAAVICFMVWYAQVNLPYYAY